MTAARIARRGASIDRKLVALREIPAPRRAKESSEMESSIVDQGEN